MHILGNFKSNSTLEFLNTNLMMISMKCTEGVYKIFTCRAKYIQCCTAHSWHSQQRRAYLGSAINSTYIHILICCQIFIQYYVDFPDHFLTRQ
jgi:hypothetical protein